MKTLLFLFLVNFSLMVFAETKVQPTREISIIFSEEGYYPKSIAVFEWEKVRFFVTSTTDKPNCFIVESHKVFLSATKGKISEGEVTFDKPGSFSFYCPSSKNDGRVVVLETKKPERAIASEKKDPLKWVPKDYEKEVGIYE